MKVLTDVHTICGAIYFGWGKQGFTYLGSEDGWERYLFQIGPLQFSWSVSKL